MNNKLFINNLKHKKMTALIVALTIALSIFFIVVGVMIIVQLVKSIEQFSIKTATPDVVQMHKGEFDKTQMENFSKNNKDVKSYQIVKMLSINGADLEVGKKVQSRSVMDVSFVKQNQKMDFLLDLDNKPAVLKRGEIGVPLYYWERYKLSLGDTVNLTIGGKQCSYKIATFIRDGQMSASAVSSKRFLIADDDFKVLENKIDNFEYLFEFTLKDSSMVSKFETDYGNKNLPKKGPMVNKQTFMILGSLSDGLVALLVIFISIFLIFLAMITIRFTFLITLEEDLKEIGTLKAIGVPKRKIRYIYVFKYLAMTIAGALFGYILAIILASSFLKNMTLYMGEANNYVGGHIYGLLSVVLTVGIVYLFTLIILRRIDKISSIDALKNDKLDGKIRAVLPLNKYHKFGSLSIFVGLRDVIIRFEHYFLPLMLFLIASFVVLIPINLSHTISDSSFIAYMGVSRADMRIDLQNIDNLKMAHDEIITTLEKDSEVKSYATFATYTFKIKNEEGIWENLNTEVGNFTQFPLDYYKGTAAKNYKEIALSVLAAKTYQVTVGSTIDVKINGQIHSMKISGLYQDITNGGKSGKATLKGSENDLLWYVVNVDLKDKILVNQKKNIWSKKFTHVKITDIDEYVNQTFDGIKTQLKIVVGASLFIALVLSVLLIALFINLKMRREDRENAIQVALGIGVDFLKSTYISGVTAVALAGIVLGTLLANSLGEVIISNLGSLFGMARIDFVTPMGISFVVLPAVLLITAIVTAFVVFGLIWRQGDLVVKVKS